MDTMLILDFLSRFIHVATAITLVGGTAFMLFVMMPAAAQLPQEEHDGLRHRVISRWKRFVHIGVTLFLLTGLYNYYRAIPNHKGDGLYHALLGTKMLLALGVFFLSAALVGRSPKLQFIRDKRAGWMKVLLVLAVAIVGISGFAKVRGIPNKSTEAEIGTDVLPVNEGPAGSVSYHTRAESRSHVA